MQSLLSTQKAAAELIINEIHKQISSKQEKEKKNKDGVQLIQKQYLKKIGKGLTSRKNEEVEPVNQDKLFNQSLMQEAKNRE